MRAVEAAQARLDVGEGQVQLRRREGRGERRVGVAVGQHEVRLALEHRRLERLQHARGLAAVAAGTDAEVEVGLRDAEFREEDVGHRRVVVLARVHDEVLDVRAAGVGGCDCAADRRELHELRARADHLHQAHGYARACVNVRRHAAPRAGTGDRRPCSRPRGSRRRRRRGRGRRRTSTPSSARAPGCRRRPRSRERPA